MKISKEILNECRFKTARASGAGGQHVNKIETKVLLFFLIKNSHVLNHKDKETICTKLSKKITNEGEIVLSCQQFKSQLKNKKKVQEKFIYLIDKLLQEPKKRKATKISKAIKAKRIKVKQLKSEIKKNRKKIRC